MASTVIAKFIDRRRADEAVRALRSAGFDAELLDYPAGGDVKVRRLGDYRVAAPEDQSDDALSLLSELYGDAPIQEGGGASPADLGDAAVVLTPRRGSDAPWLSLKRRSSTLSEILRRCHVPFAVVAALAVAAFVLRAIWNLITYGSMF